MFNEIIKTNSGAFFLIFIFLIVSFQFGQCTKSTSNDDNTDDNTNGSSDGNKTGEYDSIDLYENTMNLKGTLSSVEVAKLMPPSTPLPDDITHKTITVESIVTRSDLVGRSDIVTRSDFIFKKEVNQSSSSGIDENDAFTLPVPIGYEFITLVKMDGDVVGLIKFKMGDKYVANVTLKPDTLFKQKNFKKEEAGDEFVL